MGFWQSLWSIFALLQFHCRLGCTYILTALITSSLGWVKRNATPELYRVEKPSKARVELPPHEVTPKHLFVCQCFISHCSQAVVCPDPRGRNGGIVPCSAWPGLLVLGCWWPWWPQWWPGLPIVSCSGLSSPAGSRPPALRPGSGVSPPAQCQ